MLLRHTKNSEEPTNRFISFTTQTLNIKKLLAEMSKRIYLTKLFRIRTYMK